MSVEYAKSVAMEFANAGKRRLAAGNQAVALRYFRSALCVNPQLSMAANHLAIARVNAGESKRGFDWFKRTVRINPAYQTAYLNYATLLQRDQRHNDAHHQARAGSLLSPGSAQAIFTLLNTSRASIDPEDFETALRWASVLIPDQTKLSGWIDDRDMKALHTKLDAAWLARPHTVFAERPPIPDPTPPESAHILSRIRDTTATFEPFAHAFVSDFLPRKLYDSLKAVLPDDTSLASLPSETRQSRRSLPQNHEFYDTWRESIESVLHTDDTLAQILALFDASYLREILGSSKLDVRCHTRVTVDNRGYALGPHRDHWSRLCTGLIYLPGAGDEARLGTTIYRRTRELDFYDWGTHHPYTGFEAVQTVPFKPNACLLFLNLGEPYHGVEPVTFQARRPVVQFSYHLERQTS